MVLVEDIISAIRVGHVLDCYGLLAAFVPDHLVFQLARSYSQIYLWLDFNKVGPMLARMNRYRSFGIDVRMVRSEKDPKFYDEEDIAKFLEG